MSKKSIKHSHKLRQQIAVEAARLINEEGIDNFQYARKKAALRFGISNEHALPDNEAILEQIKIHQTLYQNPAQKQVLEELRQTALNAMRLLKQFQPKLIGSVLLGHAHEESSIDILLIADSPEEIALFLIEHKIPYKLQDWKLFFNKHHFQLIPSYQFFAGNYLVKLITLTENQSKKRPINPVNWKPMQRASIQQLEALSHTHSSLIQDESQNL